MKYKSALRNKWNTESEKLVKQIGERAQGYIWMCERDATYYSRLSTLFTVVAALLSLGVGTGQIAYSNGVFNSSSADGNTEYVSVQTSLGIVSYIVAGLVSILKLNNFDTTVDKLKRSGSKLRDIYADVQQQLGMQRVDRFPAKEYIRVISKKYNKIVSSKTFGIRRHTANKFHKKFFDKGISLPEIAGDIEEIMIAEPKIISISPNRDSDITDDSYAEHEDSYSNTETEDSDTETSSESEQTSIKSTLDKKADKRKKKENKDNSSSEYDNSRINNGEEDIKISKQDGSAEDTTSSKKSSKEANVTFSVNEEMPKQRRSMHRKKTRKSTSMYMGYQHHAHQPNLNAINYQLTRFAE